MCKRLFFLAALALAPLLGLFDPASARAGSHEPPSYFTPQGRLVAAASSCSSAAPVMTSDVGGATVVCYVPYSGQAIIVGGVPYTFGTLTLTLSQTNHAIGANYDIWAVVSSGAVALCAEGSLWSSTTARSGTPAFSGGVLTNPSVLTHCYNGSTDYGTVAASAATYLGSFYVPSAAATTVSSQTSSSTTLTTAAALTGAGLFETYYVAVDTGANLEYEKVTAGFGTASLTVTRGQLGTSAVAHSSAAVAIAGGQTAMQFDTPGVTGGAAPLLGLCNAYNQVPAAVSELDTTSSWTYATSTWRRGDNNIGNTINYLDCMATVSVEATYLSLSDPGNNSGYSETGVARDWSSGAPAFSSQNHIATASSLAAQIPATATFPPELGLRVISALEYADGTVSFWSGSGPSNSILTARLLQ